MDLQTIFFVNSFSQKKFSRNLQITYVNLITLGQGFDCRDEFAIICTTGPPRSVAAKAGVVVCAKKSLLTSEVQWLKKLNLYYSFLLMFFFSRNACFCFACRPGVYFITPFTLSTRLLCSASYF